MVKEVRISRSSLFDEMRLYKFSSASSFEIPVEHATLSNKLNLELVRVWRNLLEQGQNKSAKPAKPAKLAKGNQRSSSTFQEVIQVIFLQVTEVAAWRGRRSRRSMQPERIERPRPTSQLSLGATQYWNSGASRTLT